MRNVMLAVVLIAPVSLADDGLKPVSWLVGGQWTAETKLPNGMAITSRLVAEWGPGQHSMRLRTYLKRGELDVPTYDAIVYVDPADGAIRYVTFSGEGTTYRGSGKIEKGSLILEQTAQGRFPASRQIFAPDAEDKNKYQGSNDWKRGDQWVRAMSAESTRGPIKAFGKSAPAKAGKLDAVHAMNGTWEFEGGVERATNEPALLGASSFQTAMAQGKLALWSVTWWDAKNKRIAIMRWRDDGVVGIGHIEIGEKRWVTMTTERTPGVAEAKTYREVMEPVDKNTQRWGLSKKTEEGWKAPEAWIKILRKD